MTSHAEALATGANDARQSEPSTDDGNSRPSARTREPKRSSDADAAENATSALMPSEVAFAPVCTMREMPSARPSHASDSAHALAAQPNDEGLLYLAMSIAVIDARASGQAIDDANG